MDFDLTEEQELVRETAAAFAEKEIKPHAARMDREGAYPSELVRRLGEIGFMGMFVPQQFGGSGMDYVAYVLAMEAISKAWASLAVIMSVHNSLVCAPIVRFGSAAQKEKYLPSLASGEKLGCYALTEPGAGSDAGSLQTKAKPEGDEYILNGSKMFVTSGSRADLALVYALTEPALGKKGISAFIVETNSPGFIVGKLEDKLGLRSSDTAAITFDNCRVPRENLLGTRGEGFRIALATLDGGRIGIAAQALGIAQGCLDDSIAHAQERRQFGKAIADFQAIQWMLADMTVEIEATRLMIFRAAWMAQEDRSVTNVASMAKLLASEAANRIAYKALQIFGGYGYTKEFSVERYFRDARITTIYEGTSEIQRLVIARWLLQGEEESDELRR
jgi:butyryl-CoA dehydrogenase